MLGDALGGFPLAAPDRPIGGSFHFQDAADADIGPLILHLRRAFHLEADRAYLLRSTALGGPAMVAGASQDTGAPIA
jgi:hypothetical protein